MGGCDWFQALVSAVGIPAVAGSDSGRDRLCGLTYGLGDRGSTSEAIGPYQSAVELWLSTDPKPRRTFGAAEGWRVVIWSPKDRAARDRGA